MYTPIEPTPEVEALNSRCKAILAEIVSTIPSTNPGVRLLADRPVYGAPERQGMLYYIREGGLSYFRENRQLFIYEEGDLVGLEDFVHKGGALITSDFSVIVDEYSGDALLAAVRGNSSLSKQWDTYIMCQLAMINALMSGLRACEVSIRPEIRTYSPGEAIIVEGSEAVEVFTMVEGRARVVVKDVEVGEVAGDEIFGVLGVLTNTARTASVVAAEPSMVVVLKRDQFVDLIQSKPLTVLKMVEDMAKTIVSLNSKVVGLSGKGVL